VTNEATSARASIGAASRRVHLIVLSFNHIPAFIELLPFESFDN
jgi:hypothetical protein